MERTLITLFLNVVIIVSGSSRASAKDAPASAEQLRSQVEAALRAKDTNGFEALVNWRGLSESMKAEMNNEGADVLGQDIASVKPAPLPANVQLTNELRGVLTRGNNVHP